MVENCLNLIVDLKKKKEEEEEQINGIKSNQK